MDFTTSLANSALHMALTWPTWMPGWLQKFMPILILLVVVTIVFTRLPKIEIEHNKAYRRRRVINWLALGLTYAFLYMGRYNIKVSQSAFGDILYNGSPLMTNQDFATIFFFGTLTYGLSFLINGPLTDRIGGKKAILIGAAGALVANLLMGLCSWSVLHGGAGSSFILPNLTAILSTLYAINMYFQSFGAVAIVKANAPWFHVRERGVFGAIFGILISLGIYFAFDWNGLILKNFKEGVPSLFTLKAGVAEMSSVHLIFFVPAAMLGIFWIIVAFFVKNTPGEAGHKDFDTADASSGDDGPQMGALKVFKMMLTNPIIITIALIEFCSGFLRQAIMQWYGSFAKQTDSVLGLRGEFVSQNWGMLLCCAGIMGGVFAGIISDRIFQSRRGPVAGILYGFMAIGSIVLLFTYKNPFMVQCLVIFMSMCVIGVHGMLSGTASMDFGGKKNVGIAVGIIDGCVYAGTAVMAITYGWLLPDDSDATAAANPDNWNWWPGAMIPIAIIGLILATRVWNAKPKPKTAKA